MRRAAFSSIRLGADMEELKAKLWRKVSDSAQRPNCCRRSRQDWRLRIFGHRVLFELFQKPTMPIGSTMELPGRLFPCRVVFGQRWRIRVVHGDAPSTLGRDAKRGAVSVMIVTCSICS